VSAASERQSAAVTAVAFDRAGASFWTGGEDGTVRHWQAATGREIGPVLRHDGGIVTLGLGEHGAVVLTESGRNTLRRWNATTGVPLGDPVQHAPHKVLCAAFDPNGTRVLTGNNHGMARLWDVSAQRPAGSGLPHANAVVALAYAPAVSLAASAVLGSDTVALWDLNTGRPIALPFRHRDAVNVVAFNADHRVMVTAGQDGVARLWAVPEPLLGHPARVALWCEVVTGVQLDEDRTIRFLSPEAWAKRRQRLRELDGPPLR
jgi:WD40 repeat protein